MPLPRRKPQVDETEVQRVVSKSIEKLDKNVRKRRLKFLVFRLLSDLAGVQPLRTQACARSISVAEAFGATRIPRGAVGGLGD